jgi:hypothetical protein
MLIGREHNPTLEKISKWNMKWVIAVSVFLSLVFNVGHIFQYQANYGRVYTNQDLTSFSLDMSFPIVVELTTALNNLLAEASYMFLLVDYLINSLAFWVINTLVEVVLIKKLHKELEDKKERSEGMSGQPHSSTAVATEVF